MNLERLKELRDIDLPNIPEITQKTRRYLKQGKYPTRYFSGNVKLATGRIWTTKGYEARRKRVLEARIP